MKVFGTDYDGVIINIESEKAKAFGLLLHDEWGADERLAAEYWSAGAGTSRRSHFDYVYEQQFGKDLNDDEYHRVEREYGTLLKTRFYPAVKLMPWALELLKYARANFEYTFISSGVPMAEIKYLVKLNGVASYFDAVLGTDEQYRSKREHFKKIVAEQRPELTVFTADGLEDMRVAKEFGAIAIGIPTNKTKSDLMAVGATYVCELKDTVKLIDGLLMRGK